MSFAGWLFIFVLIVLYFLPSIIGFSRKKSNSGAIFALNLLLGWIFVGWVISLVWALTTDQKPVVVMMQQPYQVYPPNYPVYPNYQQPMMPPAQNQAYGQGQGYYTQPPVPGGFTQVPPNQPNYQTQPQSNQPYPDNPPTNPWN